MIIQWIASSQAQATPQRNVIIQWGNFAGSSAGGVPGTQTASRTVGLLVAIGSLMSRGT